MNTLTPKLPRILITAFEPFGSYSTNPTKDLIPDISQWKSSYFEVESIVLPVTFEGAIQKVYDAANDVQAIIHLGLADNRSSVSFEKIAINWNDARIADNNGAKPSRGEIILGGVAGIFSTFPQTSEQVFLDIGKTLNLSAEISYSAGTYVCNNLYYKSLQKYSERNHFRPVLFIHIPPFEMIPKEKILQFLFAFIKFSFENSLI